MLLKDRLKKNDFLDLEKKVGEFLDEKRRDRGDFSGYERRDQGWKLRKPNSSEWKEEKAKWEQNSKFSK